MSYDNPTALETAFETAGAAFRTAKLALAKSKSQKNRVAYALASEAFDTALTALHAEMEVESRVALRAFRMEVTAPRRLAREAVRAAQMDLFA